MNINKKMQDILKKHKSDRKKASWTVILSLVVVLTVITSLITPAVSMTIEDSPLAAMGLIGVLGENSEKKADSTSGALEIKKGSEYVKSLNVSAIGLEDEYNGDSASVEFSLDYVLSADSRNSLNLNGSPNLYIPLNNFQAGYLLDEDVKLNTISDAAWGGGVAGTFEITPNGISVTFTPEYKEYLQDLSDGDITGNIQFSGEIKRDESEDGDKTVTIAGEEIVVKFKDREPEVSKRALTNVYSNDNDEKVVKWEVNITSNGADLSKYSVSDIIKETYSDFQGNSTTNSASADIRNITFNPQEAGVLNTDGTISLSGKQNVKITYETVVHTVTNTGYMGMTYETLPDKIENEFGIKYGDDESHVGKAEKKPEGLNVAKTGEPDYATGKIKWTVTINNPLESFLNGYTIDDTITSSVDDEKVTFSTPKVKEPANGEISDDWKLSNVGTAKRVVIEYETTAEAGHTYTNEVEMKGFGFMPNVKSDPAVVKYKDTSEVVKLDKNGNYLENKHEIEWTVTASADGNYKFDGYEVTDEKFPADVTITYYKDGKEVTGASSAVKAESGNKYTITDSAAEQSFDTVVFTYKTKVEVPEKDSTGTNVVNKVEGGKGTVVTTVTDNVYVQFRNGITKKLSKSKDKTTTVTDSDKYTKDFEWEVILNRDAKFAGQTYTDTISKVDSNATHVLKSDSIVVYASTNGETYGEPITTGYTVNKTADGFTLEFTDFDSDNDYNFVKIKYKTTATIDAVEDDETDYKSYEFKNTGKWGDQSSSPTATITRKKPINITIKKEWEGIENTDDNNAVFELQFKSAETGWAWCTVKQDENGNYVLSTDSELDSVQMTLNFDNDWKTEFLNLPSDAYYRVVEVSFNDGTEHELLNQYGSIDERVVLDDAWYDISYSPNVNNNGTNKTETITVTNAYKQNPTKELQVQKAFGDDTIKGMFEDITVQLQQKRTDRDESEWKPYPDETSPKTATLNSDNNWSCEWENLPYQELDNDNGYVITYEYRVVETAYTGTGENKGEHTINGEVYKIGDKYYQYTGSEDDGIYTITNSEYKNTETKDIMPYKFWAGDDNFKEDRPDAVVFVLQKKNYDETWEDVRGTLDTSDSTKVIVDESSDKIIEITLSPNQYNIDQYLYESGIPNVNNLFGLPKYDIHENEDGSIVRYEIMYNFREAAFIVDGKRIEPENGSFKTENGIYRPEKEQEDTQDGVVRNYFTSASGVEKTALDDKGNSISYIDSADLKQNEDCPYYAKIDGEKYYVFNWQISYKDASQLSTLEDELPQGFTLCTDSNYVKVDGSNYHYWIDNQVNPKTPEGVLKYFGTNYYKTPVKLVAGYTCTGLPTVSKENIFDNSYPESNHQAGDLRYYYDTSENKVYFNKYNNENYPAPTICYSIKIPCGELESMLKTGNKPVTNKVVTYGDDGDETGSAEGTLTITVPSDLISKSFKSSGIPGYVQYTLDVNPEGKNLSNGSMIDIKDIFKTNSYIDTCHNNTETKGDKLVDVLMDRLKLYKVDANGVKSELGQNEYTMKFASGKSAKDSTALLELSIPDEMHVEIQYTYKIVANENTPSVKNGCKSAVIKNNRYDTMKPGYVPPTGHKIAFENKAQLISDSATAEDIHTENEYRISRSSGTISTSGRPKIKKVDVGNYSINNLDATFLMAEYKDDAWYFAESVGDNGTVTWSETPMSGDMVDEEAGDIEVKKEISLEQEVLYKLIEVSVPEGYEGSNLFGDKTKFRELIVNYLNTGETGEDYATFLNKYVSTHYFVYNSDISAVVTPDGVSSDDIMQIRSGDDIEIPNSKLINIGVAKEWYGGTVNDDTEITVELYWSYEKSTSGIPTSAKLASADDLGIMSSFTPTKILTMSELKNKDNAVWTDLPNGKDSKPIYYYVKEKAYKVDKITYTLDESGKFVSSNYVDGGYLPVYVGNALNDNGTVTIKNSNELTLIKEWKNANGKPASAAVTEITVTVYGIDKNGNKDTLFTDIKLGNGNDWRADLDTTDIDLSKYKSFEVAESPDPSGKYVVSCVFNINQNTGEITVTNKNTNATDVTVSVKKHWSDGETVHLKDSVEVVLYQSTKPLASLDKATISDAIADKTLTEYKRTTLSANKEDEVLNWAYSWAGLPLHKINDDGSEDVSITYYYYVFEESMELMDSNLADKYETTYKDSKSGISTLYDYTISNTRNAIVVQKQWVDENGEELTDNEIPTSIDVVIYKLNGEAKEYLTENGTTEDIDDAKKYTVNADGSWTAAIDVPAGDDKYYVEEVGLPNIWKASVENDGQKAKSETPVIITNKRDVHKTSIEVKKIWVGDVDEKTMALLPNNFYLLRCTKNEDGTYTEYEPVNTDDPVPVKGADNVWRYDNLPMQDANGNTYYYTVDELEIAGYSKTPAMPEDIFEATADVNSGTVEITNTKQISITVNKKWSDGDDKHLTENIKVQLYRSTSADDTAESETVGDPVTIDAKSGWTHTFSGLDVYNGDNAYYYWVEEESINGYTPAYTYTDGDNDTENAVNASELGDGVIEILNTSNFTDSIELPSTGGKGTAPYHMAGMLIIGGSLFGIIYYRRRRRRA